MPSLIATKSMTYATRRLKPGDPFEANQRDARILRAIKKATDAPTRVAPAAEQSAIETLRMQAGAIGVRVDGRWSEARIQHEIDMRKTSAAAAIDEPAVTGIDGGSLGDLMTATTVDGVAAAAEEEKKPVPAEHMPQEPEPEQKKPVPAEHMPKDAGSLFGQHEADQA